MAHLIQPIEVLGTLLCIKHGGLGYSIGASPWRTFAVCDDGDVDNSITASGAEDDDRWNVACLEGDQMYLYFAVSCISGIDFIFTASPGGASQSAYCTVDVNGVNVANDYIHADSGDGQASWFPTITLDPDIACGSMVRLGLYAYGLEQATIEITSIT